MRRLGDVMGRLTKVTMPRTGPVPDPAVLAELAALRGRLDDLVGTLVASTDGLLVAHDLPPSLEPAGLAAMTASHLGLSQRLTSIAHGGGLGEIVVRGTAGHVVVYSAGPTAALTVLAGPSVNVGRLHLESRPVARNVAELLARSGDTNHRNLRRDL